MSDASSLYLPPPSSGRRWAHHLACIIADDTQHPELSFLLFAIFFLFLFLWSLVLWVISRTRDRDAAQDKTLEKTAAEQAARCRVLVNAMLPPVAMEAIRERLVEKLPPTVAYNVTPAVLLQTDIVVRSRLGPLHVI